MNDAFADAFCTIKWSNTDDRKPVMHRKLKVNDRFAHDSTPQSSCVALSSIRQIEYLPQYQSSKMYLHHLRVSSSIPRTAEFKEGSPLIEHFSCTFASATFKEVAAPVSELLPCDAAMLRRWRCYLCVTHTQVFDDAQGGQCRGVQGSKSWQRLADPVPASFTEDLIPCAWTAH